VGIPFGSTKSNAGSASITQQAIRRGSFHSVRELIRPIDEFVQHYNRNSQPLSWTATANSIFQKRTRL
jgi:putative transposase